MSTYSENEIKQIYCLGYSFLINGNYKSAEYIFQGLVSVQPDYKNAYLALATTKFLLKEYDSSNHFCKKLMEIDRFCIEALLLHVANCLKLNDVQSAGTYLGEVKDILKEKTEISPEIIKYEKLLNMQYQAV